MSPDFEWHTRDEKLQVVAYWWEQQGGRCCLCHHIMKPYSRQHTTDQEAATIEHLIPRRDGGRNVVGNVRLAHGRCNHALGALYEQNRQRAKLGKPQISAKEAITNAAGRERTKERDRLRKEAETRNRVPGATMAAMIANGEPISLPRGATLVLPIEHTRYILKYGKKAYKEWLAGALREEVS